MLTPFSSDIYILLFKLSGYGFVSSFLIGTVSGSWYFFSLHEMCSQMFKIARRLARILYGRGHSMKNRITWFARTCSCTPVKICIRLEEASCVHSNRRMMWQSYGCACDHVLLLPAYLGRWRKISWPLSARISFVGYYVKACVSCAQYNFVRRANVEKNSGPLSSLAVKIRQINHSGK
jgi:hypothetical protein